MFAIRDKSVIQIEVTNSCERECTNCSRFVGHYRNTYFMDLDQVEKAIDSLRDFPGVIGIMGGEPLKHPGFMEICRMMKQMLPPEKRYLWTSGYNWDTYRQVIRKTFGGNIHFNNHNDSTQKHHPMLLSISDIIEDRNLVRQLVDNCWVNMKWSASVNPKGAFFCEIAAAMDVLFEGPGGHPVERGWWDKDPEAFREQRERYCYRCGACVPYFPVRLTDSDVASVSNYLHLKEVDSPKLRNKGIRLHKEELSQQQLEELAREWQPWKHLGVMEKEGSGENEVELYGKPYGYFIKLKKNIGSRHWALRRAERAVGRWLWHLQSWRSPGHQQSLEPRPTVR
ncbi:MAG: radical SAM protein [Geobacteraceae bacterium]|nr:radical SAM protein [Geobacteraceae bacterium]